LEVRLYLDYRASKAKKAPCSGLLEELAYGDRKAGEDVWSFKIVLCCQGIQRSVLRVDVNLTFLGVKNPHQLDARVQILADLAHQVAGLVPRAENFRHKDWGGLECMSRVQPLGAFGGDATAAATLATVGDKTVRSVSAEDASPAGAAGTVAVGDIAAAGADASNSFPENTKDGPCSSGPSSRRC